MTQRMASTAPAAPSRWPVIDLVELTGGISSPNTWRMAAVSHRSFMGVLVPWALMYPIRPGSRAASARASRMQRTAPSPSGAGAVMW